VINGEEVGTGSTVAAASPIVRNVCDVSFVRGNPVHSRNCYYRNQHRKVFIAFSEYIQRIVFWND